MSIIIPGRSSQESTARNPRITRLLASILCTGLLAACAHQPMLYSWDSYQPAVYASLQGDEDSATQVLAMEKNIETARARNVALPPGFHAHLGMLYLKQGQDARAMEQIQSERAAFPESASFMDFLLRRTKDTQAAGAPEATPDSKSAQPSAATKTPLLSDQTDSKHPS